MEIVNEALDSLEIYKEIARIQYDYFKHLSTLSTASIGAILAFVVKIFSSSCISSSCIDILAGLSLISFFICIFVCLSGMTEPANIIGYLTSIQSTAISKQEPEKLNQEIEKLKKKFKVCGKKIQKAHNISKYSFLMGIVFFVAYATISLISSR